MRTDRGYNLNLFILLAFSILTGGNNEADAFSSFTQNLRPSTSLYGVLSPSQIVKASTSKKKSTPTTPIEESQGYYRLVLAEITCRQERILDALERELRKTDLPDEENDKESGRRSKKAKKIQKITQRQAEISILLESVQQIEKILRRKVSMSSVRHSIVELGFDSILTEPIDDWMTERTFNKEFGRPKGFDGLIFYTPLGVPILVGTQGSHGDETLRQVSQGMDLWFQVEGYCGSRVLLRTSLMRSLKGSKYCTQMAADLAAHYSDSRWENNVPIMYTDSRHVAKRGSKSGQMKKRKSFGRIIGHPDAVSKITNGRES